MLASFAYALPVAGPETGIRIARALGHSDDFWVQLQADYDMRMARREMGDVRIQRVVTA